MSLSNSTRIPIELPNVDVFIFGKSSLYGYDSLNHCIIVHSLIDINNTSINRYHLSSSPTWPIQRLILNQDETILSLIAEKIVYLVYLPKLNLNSPSKGSHLCPIIRVPPLASSSILNSSVIDFVWLTTNHFVIVYSIPSSNECHLYLIRPSKQESVQLIQTFSCGSSSKTKFGTPNKKLSLYQTSDIIKLDVAKREENDSVQILLFAMKADGDIFILEIDQNQLLSNENSISSDFIGPIRILPSTHDNYGSDHGHSTFICLSNSNNPVIIFTRNKCELNQCILLSPSANQYYLFTIDSIHLPTNQNGQIITSIIADPVYSNRYYITDSIDNVYSIDISWIKQISQGQNKLQSTHIQHLINNNISNNQIQQIGFIQTNNYEQALVGIIKSQTNQKKELILIRCQSSSESKCSDKPDLSFEFVDHIRSLLLRDQSFPYVTLSSSTTTNISNSDFENNLSKFMKLFHAEYISKQEKVRVEIKDKEDYLLDYQQTQLNENKELNKKVEQTEKQFQLLTQLYNKEFARRKRLRSCINDLLSVVEQSLPVVSDSEMRMQQQLERYEIQTNCFQDKLRLLQQFISVNQNSDEFDHLSMENIRDFVQNQRKQIDQMKKQLETIQNKN